MADGQWLIKILKFEKKLYKQPMQLLLVHFLYSLEETTEKWTDIFH